MSLKRQLNTPEKLIPDNKMNRFDVLRDEADTAPELSAEQPVTVPMKEVDTCSASSTSSSAAKARRALALNTEEAEDGDPPPRWFSKFTSRLESRFTSLEHHMESLVVEKLEKINQKVKANEETISAYTIQVDEVVKEVKQIEA